MKSAKVIGPVLCILPALLLLAYLVVKPLVSVPGVFLRNVS